MTTEQNSEDRIPVRPDLPPEMESPCDLAQSPHAGDPPRFPEVIELLKRGKADEAAEWIIENLEPWQWTAVPIDILIQGEYPSSLMACGGLAKRLKYASGGTETLEFMTEEVGSQVSRFESGVLNSLVEFMQTIDAVLGRYLDGSLGRPDLKALQSNVRHATEAALRRGKG